MLRIRSQQLVVLAADQHAKSLHAIEKWMTTTYPEKYGLMSAEALREACESQIQLAGRFGFAAVDQVIRFTDVQHRVGAKFPDGLPPEHPMKAILNTATLNPAEKIIALESRIFPAPSTASL